MIRRAAFATCILATMGLFQSANALDKTPPTAGQAQWKAGSAKSSDPARAIQDIVRPEDVRAVASAQYLYPPRNVGLQCQGTSGTLADIPNQEVRALRPDGSRQIRFGEVLHDKKSGLRLQISAQDVIAKDASPRCELVFYPMPDTALPEAETFWFSTRLWLNDWAGSVDQQIISQMHTADPRDKSLNPFLALVVRGNKLHTEVRWNPDATPRKASTKLYTYDEVSVPADQWVDITIKARISADDLKFSFIRVWLNDRLIADHNGPIGYKSPTRNLNYVKTGIYHWAADNPWDSKIDDRYLVLGSMALIADQHETYTLEQVRRAAKKLTE